jgi:hypothetical protein
MTVMAMLHLPEEETTIVNIANKLGATKQNVTQLIGSRADVFNGFGKKEKNEFRCMLMGRMRHRNRRRIFNPAAILETEYASFLECASGNTFFVTLLFSRIHEDCSRRKRLLENRRPPE